MSRIAVLGGGISGLAAAWKAQKRGAEVSLFEASDRIGGVIRSVRRDGFLVDEGPNTLVARHAVVGETIEALGLEEDRVWADENSAHRYVVRDGVPVALPSSPGSFLKTSIFSARGKLRLLREPFIGPSDADDEPLSDFVRRRLGSEVLDYAVDPFVGGILAGDPARLSTRYAFPPLWEVEQSHGSLFRGMLSKARNRKDAPPSSRPFSFRDGMQTLPDALARILGGAIYTDAPVVTLSRGSGSWAVTTQQAGETRTEHFDKVISALPLHRFADLDIDAEIDRAALDAVAHTDLSVLALGFRRDQVEHPLDGFGLLVPSREPFEVLGVLFSSSLFPGRAPEGHVLLTCFVGGRRKPEQASLPPDRLLALALGDLRALLGVRGEPLFTHRASWKQVIPQAEIGYGRVLDAISTIEEQHPSLGFAGSYRYGVSVGDALRSGLDAADRLLA